MLAGRMKAASLSSRVPVIESCHHHGEGRGEDIPIGPQYHSPQPRLWPPALTEFSVPRDVFAFVQGIIPRPPRRVVSPHRRKSVLVDGNLRRASALIEMSVA